MHYDISIIGNIACVTVEGNVNSLDLMFMFQSKAYKEIMTHNSKIMLDYTNISGSTIIPQDAIAITTLGKMDLVNVEDITIALAINECEDDVIKNMIKNIFSGNRSNVLITDSKDNAMKMLN